LLFVSVIISVLSLRVMHRQIHRIKYILNYAYSLFCVLNFGVACMHTKFWRGLHAHQILAWPACTPNFGVACMHTKFWRGLHAHQILAWLAFTPNLGVACMHTKFWRGPHAHQILQTLLASY